MVPFTPPDPFTTRPTLRGGFGMVSSTHWLASASAQAVLERGGNAFDAAVAGGFVLHVVEPHLNGPGGDLVGLVCAPGEAAPSVLMGQGPAPEAATIGHFAAEGLDMVPGAGALAAAVPGAVDAWLLLLRTRGTWELADVLEPALFYAEQGHPLAPQASAAIAAVADLFTRHWPSSARLWMPDGVPPAPGTAVRNPEYAATLRRLVDAGRRAPDRGTRIEAARHAWREGFVARAAADFAAEPHRHSSGSDHSGVLAASDFAAFQASYEAPVLLEFRGHTVAKPGGWSQGPALLQALAILDGFADEDLDPSTERGAHTVLEALKLALADRDAYYGDAAGPDAVPLAALLDPGYAGRRRKLIGPTASHEFRPGEASGHRPYLPELVAEGGGSGGAHGTGDAQGAGGEPTVSRHGEVRGDTCHIDVADRWGNMAAVTPSGGWLQSSPAIPELGFCLGTRLQMTWLDPESPSALVPGRRPRTTLTPTMLLRGGRATAALGSPGGDQQDQWQLLYLLRTLVGGYEPQQAIDAPMFHTTSAAGSFWPRTWTPGGAVAEDRLGADVLAGLRRRGHRVAASGPWTLGRLCVAGRNGDGTLYAAANPRGAQGYAAGR